MAFKNEKKIGAIPPCNIVFKKGMKSSEISFKVYKNANGTEYKDWALLKDFMLLWCKEWNIWFEIAVEIEDGNELVKNVSAVSLGAAELSQINLYETEINTENDITRDDYSPTVLCDDDNPKASLLHRILEKAPHYKIRHVDISLKNIQRTFSFDRISIYEAFQQIEEEINCIIIVDVECDANGNTERSVSAYDLEAFCANCGERGDFTNTCPKCNSSNIITGYGKDSTIFISTKNLADGITFTTDTGSVKNCFKLIAGDDLMTAAIRSCNPTGSDHLWFISDEVKSNMSAELRAKLNEYDKMLAEYQNNYEINIDKEIINSYNNLLDNYAGLLTAPELNNISINLQKTENPIKGYTALTNAYFNTIDFYLLLNNSLMPKSSLQTSDEGAYGEYQKIIGSFPLTDDNLKSVAVKNIEICTRETASNAILLNARAIVSSRYGVKVQNAEYNEKKWSGNLIITNYTDETDTYTSDIFTVQLTDNYEQYIKAKLLNALNRQSDEITDVVSLFELDIISFSQKIQKYSLSYLLLLYDLCQSCLDILTEQSVIIADEENASSTRESLYFLYYIKSAMLQHETEQRKSEIAIITGERDSSGRIIKDGLQTLIEKERAKIQNSLNLENFLGDLWMEFVLYRREDVYQNDNYISDGLDNANLLENALEFIETAKKEIVKSATRQHKISASLKNLLTMKEFSPLTEHFETGNWIRVEIDGVISRLRLLEYEIEFDNSSQITVTFSDVIKGSSGTSDIESILKDSVSMASSYSATVRQSEQGKKSNKQLTEWVNKGLSLTNMKIVDNADNQNISWDSHGLLCKEYLPITDEYDRKQLKLINRGLYLTDNNWLNIKTAIGDYKFYNPITRKMQDGYGVIADTLIGHLILSEEVGIYNKENSVLIDNKGISISVDKTEDTENTAGFTITKKTLDNNGEIKESKTVYINEEGDLELAGSIKISSDINNAEGTLGALSTQFNDLSNKTQYMNFTQEDGLTIGESTQGYKIGIKGEGIEFKYGEETAATINGAVLNIPNAVIENNLTFGGFQISPRSDGGASLIWIKD